MLEEETSIFMCFFPPLLLSNKRPDSVIFNLYKSLDSLKLLEELKIKAIESGTEQ